MLLGLRGVHVGGLLVRSIVALRFYNILGCTICCVWIIGVLRRISLIVLIISAGGIAAIHWLVIIVLRGVLRHVLIAIIALIVTLILIISLIVALIVVLMVVGLLIISGLWGWRSR